MNVAGSGAAAHSYVDLPPPSSPATVCAFLNESDDSEGTSSTIEEKQHIHQQRIEQRSKQVALGKITAPYFIQQQQLAQGDDVPRPATPRADLNNTKRQFDARVRCWRRALHRLDPEGDKAREDCSPHTWTSPALQAAFDRLAYYYPAVRHPLELIEGDHRPPAPLVLDCIEAYFHEKRVGQNPAGYLQRLAADAVHLNFDRRLILRNCNDFGY
jgi:hypothetical protein